ncbi:MAG: DUF6191 domain-containing protein [Actinomycetota bacterium]|nr:DUF6191 domain-containing protein [Actinomycetota bacterium]
MGELGALFNPGMRHEIEERKAKESRREEAGNADPGNKRIDLLSGVAVINMGSKTPKQASQEAHTMSHRATDTDQPDTDQTDTNQTDTNQINTNQINTDPTNTDEDRSDERVQSGSAGSAETTRGAQADQGTAPRVNGNVDASEHSNVDPAALEITQQSSNSEPPA